MSNPNGAPGQTYNPTQEQLQLDAARMVFEHTATTKKEKEAKAAEAAAKEKPIRSHHRR